MSKAGHKEVIGETIAKLVLYRNGFNPYSRFLDTEAIDILVRNDKNNNTTYNEIQIKYSKKYQDPKENYWFSIQQSTFKPRHYFYFMFICENEDQILIIPSLTIGRMLDKLKITIPKGKKLGKWHFIVDRDGDRFFLRTKRGEEKIEVTNYLNNYEVLK
jgi:hypothetical protein